MKKSLSFVPVLALVLVIGLVAGCSSATKAKVTDAVKGPACTAIASAQAKLAGAENQTPEQLQQVQTTAKTADAAITALGDKIPADLSAKVDEASQKLDDAVTSAKASAADAKTKVKDAAANYGARLDEVKVKLGC